MIIGSQTSCKLFQARDLFVAIAGLVRYEEVDVIEAIKNSREFRGADRGERLVEVGPVFSAEEALRRVLRKRNVPYDPNMEVALIIAGKIGGKLEMYRVRIVPVPPNTVPGQASEGAFGTSDFGYPRNREAAVPSPNRGVEIIGLSSAITQFRHVLPEWANGTDVDVAKWLVAIEASDSIDSRFVGTPISVLMIDQKGTRWADKGACAWEP
jgi:hypothetical protein